MSENENDDYEEELDDEGWGDQSLISQQKIFKLNVINRVN